MFKESVNASTTYIEISWKNRAFLNDKAVQPQITCLQSLDTVKQFKNEVSCLIGIPIEYIQVFHKGIELQDNKQMKDYTNSLIEIVTDSNRQITNTMKFRTVNIINPSSITDIEMKSNENVKLLKEKIIEKEKIFLKDNEYLALFYWDKASEKAVEIFEMEIIDQYYFKPLQPLHFITKKLTDEIAEKIGRAVINVVISWNQQKYSIKINQQETFAQLKTKICQVLNIGRDTFKLIYCGNDITNVYENKRLNDEKIINGSSFYVIPIA